MLDKESINSINKSDINDSTINQYANCIFINAMEDSEILDKIIKEMLVKTKDDINIGNYEEVNVLLKGFMTSDGFDRLSKNAKTDIIYYRAINLLNMGKYEEAKTIAEQILGIDSNCDKYYKFDISLNILLVNRKEYNKSINILKEKHINEKELEIYEIKMLYNEKKYDEIIKRYITNELANEKLPRTNDCIGILISSLMIKDDIKLASKIIEKIDIQTEYIVYLKAIVNLAEILNDKNSVLGINEFDKNILDENIELLESVKGYFKKNIVYKKYYYYYLLRALIVKDPEQCINEYEKLDDELKKEIELLITYIDSLILTNKIDLAEKAIKNISNYTEKIVLLVRLIDVLNTKKEYSKIIELLKERDLINLDDNGFLATKYVEALLNQKGFEETERIVPKKYLQYSLVDITIAEFLYNNRVYTNRIIQFCDQAIKNIDFNDELIVGILSEKLEKMKLFNKGIELLEKSQMKYVRTKIMYIRSVIQAHKCSESSNSNALKIIDDIIDIKGKSNEFLIYKGDLLRKKNRKDEAFKCYEEAFDINNNYVAAYYCLSYKYEIQDYYNIEKYINCLDNSTDLEHMVIIAGIYAKQKNYEKANKKIYNIIYYMKNNTDMDVLSKIIFGIFFMDYNEYKWKKYERVETDTIVILQGEDGNSKKICIEADLNIQNEKEILYDVELYGYQSIVKNELIMKKKNEKVTINGILYTIKNIINKYEYFMIKIRDEFFKNLPDNSKYGMVIKTDINSGNPLKDIIPILQDRKNHIENIVNKYRMKNNEIGLTLSNFSKHLGTDEFTSIISLLNDTEGMYYTGEITNDVVEEYVITTTSLIVLKYFGMDKILIDNKEKIHIAESSIQKLNKHFIEKTKEKPNSSLGIGNDNKPYMLENSEKKIKDEIEFIREIISIANQLKIEKNSYREDKFNVFSILSEEEQDAMCIATNNNYTLITDDLCLRKIYWYICNKNKHSNSMEFLKYMTFNERIETLEKVSKTQYLYCINKDIVLELLFFGKDDIKIKKIIANLLETEEKYKYNREIIGEAVLELYNEIPVGQRRNRLMGIIQLIFDFDKKYRENHNK